MTDIDVTTRDGVATVVIDRPPVNAITLAHYARLGEIFADLGTTFDVNCVILTAAGTGPSARGSTCTSSATPGWRTTAAEPRSSARRSSPSAAAGSR
jgi:1,4-dihydroxy-2-naphthoyl-CoA synthase